jgi:hypothetical protein
MNKQPEDVLEYSITNKQPIESLPDQILISSPTPRIKFINVRDS